MANPGRTATQRFSCRYSIVVSAPKNSLYLRDDVQKLQKTVKTKLLRSKTATQKSMKEVLLFTHQKTAHHHILEQRRLADEDAEEMTTCTPSTDRWY